MQTLLTTNILLAVIVLCIIVLTILVSILIIQMIGTTRKVNRIIQAVDDDIHRTRSVIMSIWNKISKPFVAKKK